MDRHARAHGSRAGCASTVRRNALPGPLPRCAPRSRTHADRPGPAGASADNLVVTRADFDRALSELQPAFGCPDDQLNECLPNGIVQYGGALPQLQQTMSVLLQQLQASSRTCDPRLAPAPKRDTVKARQRQS